MTRGEPSPLRRSERIRLRLRLRSDSSEAVNATKKRAKVSDEKKKKKKKKKKKVELVKWKWKVQKQKDRVGVDEEMRESRLYGKAYRRKRKRVGVTQDDDNKKNRCEFGVVMKPRRGGDAKACSRFLFMTMCYLRRLRFTLTELADFLLMEPFRQDYASHGLRLLQGAPVSNNVGVCLFYGITQLMPLFCVDFSAIPLCFLHMHSSISLRSMFRSLSLVYSPANAAPEVVVVQDDLSVHSILPGQEIHADTSNGAFSIKMITVVTASDEKLASLASSFTTTASASSEATETLYLPHCSANILIPGSEDSDSNIYYRVRGAVITFEQIPSSRDWLLAVKKDGITWHTFKTKKNLKSSSSKRFASWRLFFLDNGWRLEFVDENDWTVFEALFKDCFGRKFAVPAAKNIPVPGVRDVSSYEETYTIPFHRPHNYISLNDNELSRAVTRKTANYDMDSEDEEWLSKFNKKSHQLVSEENFELIIDALEKVFYFSSDNCSDRRSPADRCPPGLAPKELVKAVSIHWMKKRKRNHKQTLLRVFQNYPTKAAIVQQPLFPWKRRTLRRRIRYDGGQYCGVWQVISEEQKVLKEMRRAEAAKASAKALEEQKT
ncbi:hypothetical protein VNO78_19874 [Psophocarpus tetragonolobus]|uniref:Enhancer of polycomb-like protein n=1 Tax=Psophocarpus tetragonolobus TaxID=3891 RepID=A0AAN9SCB7_PSOTE